MVETYSSRYHRNKFVLTKLLIAIGCVILKNLSFHVLLIHIYFIIFFFVLSHLSVSVLHRVCSIAKNDGKTKRKKEEKKIKNIFFLYWFAFIANSLFDMTFASFTDLLIIIFFYDFVCVNLSSLMCCCKREKVLLLMIRFLLSNEFDFSHSQQFSFLLTNDSDESKIFTLMQAHTHKQNKNEMKSSNKPLIVSLVLFSTFCLLLFFNVWFCTEVLF